MLPQFLLCLNSVKVKIISLQYNKGHKLIMCQKMVIQCVRTWSFIKIFYIKKEKKYNYNMDLIGVLFNNLCLKQYVNVMQ